MAKKEFKLILKDFKMITPKVRHMIFTTESSEPFNFTPGQFITFHFEVENETFNRSYSVATIPTQSQDIEIAVSPFPGGPGTEFLFHLTKGENVTTTGPFGRLILRDEIPKRYFMLATGTGVTPYRSMLPQLHERLGNHDMKVIILQGVQTPEDLLYGEDFWNFAKKHPNLEFHAFYSRHTPSAGTLFEHQGYVQHFFQHETLDPEQDIFYLCGNPDMIDESFNFLLDKGFSIQNIRREKYISPKKRN